MYWFILKTFLNNKKIPLTPPLFHENKLKQTAKRKRNFLILFFCKPVHFNEQQQCLAQKSSKTNQEIT